MRQLTKIYIHCSYSNWGDVNTVRSWHMNPPNSWSDIGYHFIVHNAFTTRKRFNDYLETKRFTSITDGEVVTGRPLPKIGAHVKDDNTYSIGICFIGVTPSAAQWGAMLQLCSNLIKKFPLISIDTVFGHHEYYTNNGKEIKKTCPNFNMQNFRQCLSYFSKEK